MWSRMFICYWNGFISIHFYVKYRNTAEFFINETCAIIFLTTVLPRHAIEQKQCNV